MARQWSMFSFLDGPEPSPSNEIAFGYQPDQPGTNVRVRFPAGERTLTPDKLAELGVLCIALAGKHETDQTFELLDGFELTPPYFMHLELLVKRASRQVAATLIESSAELTKLYGTPGPKREQFEAAIAKRITTVLRQNA